MPTSVVMNKILVSSPCKKNSFCSDQTSSSSSSSSIGKNSDLSEDLSDEKFGDGDEVQSKCKGGPLDAMDSLEEVLPMRRGISRFYTGKSKTFASLLEASLSSVKEIAKPSNAYSRRRRNLLAHGLKNGGGGGISKRVAGSGRSTLGLAMVMNSSESDFIGNNMSSSWRSYSLSDLQQQCVDGVGVRNLYAKPT